MDLDQAILILGAKTATKFDDIKKCFRELAVKYHPDKSNEKNCEQKFKDIAEAYSTICDYHQHGGTFPIPYTQSQSKGKTEQTTPQPSNTTNKESILDHFSELFGTVNQTPYVTDIVNHAGQAFENFTNQYLSGMGGRIKGIIATLVTDRGVSYTVIGDLLDILQDLPTQIKIEAVPAPNQTPIPIEKPIVQAIAKPKIPEFKPKSTLQKITKPKNRKFRLTPVIATNPANVAPYTPTKLEDNSASDGTLYITKNIFNQYLDKSNNGQTQHPLFGELCSKSNVTQCGTFWGVMQSPGLITINDKLYNLRIK